MFMSQLCKGLKQEFGTRLNLDGDSQWTAAAGHPGSGELAHGGPAFLGCPCGTEPSVCVLGVMLDPEQLHLGGSQHGGSQHGYTGWSVVLLLSFFLVCWEFDFCLLRVLFPRPAVAGGRWCFPGLRHTQVTEVSAHVPFRKAPLM